MSELLTATDLEQWSERNDSREHLPTLVRRLILATAAPDSLRMPAAEGVGLPGLDGEVTCPAGAPPFVPAGTSVWEMGTGNDPQSKAQSDYRKRLDEFTPEQRAGLEFVFVTSRRWPDSQAWIARRGNDDDGWAGIRVLDAEDLAAWLALCTGVHRWLASEQLGRDPHGLIGLRDWYRNWAERTHPSIPPALLLCGRDAQVRNLLAGLRAAPREHVIASASRDESVAFFAASLLAVPPIAEAAQRHVTDDPPSTVIEEGQVDVTDPHHGDVGDGPAAQDTAPAPDVDSERQALLERAVVVEDARAWRQVAAHERPMTLVPVFAEPEIGDALRAGHHVVLPRAGRPADARLPRLHRALARQVWTAAGVDHDRAEEYGRAARRSLASLRRRIGRPGWLREPPWAADSTANLLAPLLLAGAWVDDVPGDLEALRDLTDRGWRIAARDLSPLTSGEDAPLLLRERRWEFADPIDAWDALNHALTAEDLDAFQALALSVLTEPDPAAGLSQEERIAASFSETGIPRRRYSNTLRRGIVTTLAILGSISGDRELPGGLTGQQRASRAVRDLLSDADAIRWHTLASLLPLIAEASPEVFLSSVEHSLDQDNPPVITLFTETPDYLGMGGGSAHSPLLWSLETLAWSPTLLSRVAVVLGRLAERDPGGRLANRPSASLAAALHLRLPQGAANPPTRIATLDAVRAVTPKAGWQLALDLVRHANRAMLLVSGPKFRDWPRPPCSTINDIVDGLDALAIRIAQDAGPDPDRLAAAFGVVDHFREPGRLAVLDAADRAWLDLQDDQRRMVLAALTDKAATHRRYPDAVWALPDAALLQLEAFLDAHAIPGGQPDDAELFSWMPFRRGLNVDPQDPNPQALAAARFEAIGQCLLVGLPAVLALADASQAPATVGDALAAVTTEHDTEVLEHLGGPSQPLHALAAGLALHRQRQDPQWLAQATAAMPEKAAALCHTASIDQTLLTLVDGLPAVAQVAFWRDMYPRSLAAGLTATIARRLLDHGRPWTAIELLSHAGFGTDADLAIEALSATQNAAAEDVTTAMSPEYTVGRLLNRLQDASVDDAPLANLEWYYQPLLDHSRTPQALHRELARDPARFVQLVSVMYPPEPASEGHVDEGSPWADAATASNIFGAAWTVLREWRRPLPGSRDGQLPATDDMLNWVRTVSDLLTQSGRARVLPIVLGDALSGAVTDEDGTWPSQPVRDLLESLGHSNLEEHLAIAKLNQRGVTSRGVYDGGEQERSLADKYKQAADRVRARWPRSGALLDQLHGSYSDDARREDRSAEGQADA